MCGRFTNRLTWREIVALAQTLPHSRLGLLRVAEYAHRQAAVLLLNGEWVTADHRRVVGRVEGHRDRRAAEVVHDDHHHRQRVRGQDPRPDAGTADALSV